MPKLCRAVLGGGDDIPTPVAINAVEIAKNLFFHDPNAVHALAVGQAPCDAAIVIVLFIAAWLSTQGIVKRLPAGQIAYFFFTKISLSGFRSSDGKTGAQANRNDDSGLSCAVPREIRSVAERDSKKDRWPRGPRVDYLLPNLASNC